MTTAATQGVPQELADQRLWLVWEHGELRRNGKRQKIPLYAGGAVRRGPNGSAEDRQQLVDLPTAQAHRSDFGGIGFAMLREAGLVALDIDNCIVNGVVHPDVLHLTQGTYRELSPSGTGVRAFYRGRIDDDKDHGAPFGFEVFCEKGFVTVTGRLLPGDSPWPEHMPLPQLPERVRAYAAKRFAGSGRNCAAKRAKVHVVRPVTEDFFRNVNEGALRNLAAWVPVLFPSAKAPRGSKAQTGPWRVTSKTLGRDLEEDISISPEGIVDFGVHDIGDDREGKRTPIDLILEWQHLSINADGLDEFATPTDAAHLLCKLLKVEPESLGWRCAKHGNDRAARHDAAAMLVDFVQARVELFHDSDNTTYALDRASGITRCLTSPAFSEWLAAEFYAASGRTVKEATRTEAVSTLAGLARHRGQCHDVYTRVAHLEGRYFLDLCEPNGCTAVEITAAGWSVIDRPPVRFVRSNSMRPLPLPERGGSIEELWRFVNVPLNSRRLVLAWLIECLRPETPYPVLEIIGEFGSAKSTTHALLRMLIDPNRSNLRGVPATVDDLFVSARSSYVASIENVSYLPGPMQDAMCMLATGGGYAKRRLYADGDEFVITLKRPLIVNGIASAITAQDLVDRTVSIETPIIEERVEVDVLQREFEALHPVLLGALLDLMSQTLCELPNVGVHTWPRLIEFAKLGCAMAMAMAEPAETFLESFQASRAVAIERTIDACPAIAALLDLTLEEPLLVISVSELLLRLSAFRGGYAARDAWPKSAKGLGELLRRHAPALRQLGIECESVGRRGADGKVHWRIVREATLPGSSSASSVARLHTKTEPNLPNVLNFA